MTVDPMAGPPADEPVWMLRVNPLRRTRLADAELAGTADRLAAAEAEVAAAAEQCSAELYEAIGAAGDDPARGDLIALRRAIHNDREPRNGQDAGLPGVARWHAARARRAALTDALDAAHPQAAARERAALAGILADEDLIRALATVAPEVHESAARYRAAHARNPELPSRMRKKERGLVQYVTRAMVRTSPLSRFTAVGAAVPDATGSAPDAVGFDKAVPFPGLDRVMLDFVLGGLAGPDGTPGPDTWIQLPPTSEFDAESGKLFFLRPEGDGMRRLSAPATPTLRLLYDALVMGPRQVSSVAATVTRRTGAAPDAALKLVLGAVAKGILCTRLGPEDGAVPCTEQLDVPGSPARDLLDRARTALRDLEANPPARERGERLAGLDSVLVEMSRTAQRPARILVEEDYILPPARIATQAWRGPLYDLSAAVELLSVFDRLHDVRALLTASFTTRFGAGANVPLTEHADALVADVYRLGGDYDGNVRPGTGPADGSLDRLHTLREQVVAAVHDRLRDADAQHGDACLTAEEARALTAQLPERFRRDAIDYSVLVQPWQGRLVFNDAYAGHGMLYGRFLGPDRELGGEAADVFAARAARRYGAGSRRVVEDRGLHRLNVNAHARILGEGIGPDDWEALRLVHDPDTDSLTVTDADGVPLSVLTLGAGHPELFPAPLALATWLISGGRLYEDLVGSWHTAAGRDPRRTRGCPRLSVGQAVVARRRWYGGPEWDAAVAAGPGEGDRMRELARWRGRHGVPEQLVLKTPLDDEYRATAQASGEDLQEHRRRQKPQYVDLSSALCTRVLPRLLERRSAGYLEEALPAVTDSDHAYEWVVEIGRASGGRFRYGGDDQ